MNLPFNKRQESYQTPACLTQIQMGVGLGGAQALTSVSVVGAFLSGVAAASAITLGYQDAASSLLRKGVSIYY